MNMKKKSISIILKLTFIFFSLMTLATCDVGLGSSVDTTAPDVTIGKPSASEVLHGEIRLEGRAHDDGNIESVIVEFKRIGSSSSALTYEYAANVADPSWNLVVDTVNGKAETNGTTRPVEDGTYQLTVTATDESKKSSIQTTTFTIDNTPPVVIVTSPDEKSASMNYDIQIDGKIYDATEIDTITVGIYDSNDNLKTSEQAKLSGTGTWTVTFDGEKKLFSTTENAILGDDTYKYSVTAVDKQGNKSTYFFHKEDIYAKITDTMSKLVESELAAFDKGDEETYYGINRSEIGNVRIAAVDNSSEDALSSQPQIKYSQKKLATITWQNIGEDAMLNEGDSIIGSIAPEMGVDAPFRNDSFKAYIYKDKLTEVDNEVTERPAETSRVSDDFIEVTNAGTNRNFKINTEGKGGGIYYVYIEIENSVGTRYKSQKQFKISLSTPKLEIFNLPGLKKITNDEIFTINGKALVSTEEEGCNLSYTMKKDGGVESEPAAIDVNKADGAWSLSVPEDDGTYEYTFTAESFGFKSTKTRTVVHDTTSPDVNITLLSQNDSGTKVSVNGTANDSLSGFDTKDDGQAEFKYCFIEAEKTPVETDWITLEDMSFYNWKFDIDSSELSEKEYKLHIRIKDTAGNIGIADKSIVIDKYKPTLTVENGNWVSNTVEAITGTAADTHFKELTVSINEKEPVVVTVEDEAWTWSPAADTADGLYNVVFEARDTAGKTKSLSTNFTLDRTKPEIEVLNIENGAVYTNGGESPLVIKGSAIDSLAGLGSIQYKVNGASEYTAIKNLSQNWTINLTGLNEGINTIQVKATDKAGNENERPLISFKVDYSTPEAFFGNQDSWNTENSSKIETKEDIVLSGKILDGNNTSEAIVSLSYSRDDGGTAEISGDDFTWNKDSSSSDYGKWTYNLPISIGDGTYIFTLSVSDIAGNTVKKTRTVLIDTTAPELDVTKPLEGESLTAAYKVAGTIRDTGARFGNETSGVFYSFDNEEWTRVPVSTANWESSLIQLPSSQGRQLVYVKASDNLGNTTGVVEREFYYDEAAPVIIESSINSMDIVAKQESFTLGGTWTETNELSKITIVYTKNGGSTQTFRTIEPAGTDADPDKGEAVAWQCEVAVDTSEDGSGEGLDSGLYEFTITAEDGAEKQSSVIRRIRIDLIPPEDPDVTSISGESKTYGGKTYYSGNVTISGTASDGGEEISSQSGISKVQYSMTGGSDESAWTDCTGTTSWTAAIDGSEFTEEKEYTLYFRAIDGSGLVNQGSVTRSIFIDKSSPQGTISVAGDNGSGIFQTNGTGTEEDGSKYVLFSGRADDGVHTPTRKAATAVLSSSKDGADSVTISDGFIWDNDPASDTFGEWSYKMPVPGDGSGDGNYQLTLTVTDVAGKTSTATKNILLDTTGPVISTSLSDNMSFFSRTNNITISCFDMHAGLDSSRRLYWKLNDEDEEHLITGSAAEIVFTEQASNQKITLVAYDKLNNKTEAIFTGITVDTEPPELKDVFGTAPQYIKAGESFSLLESINGDENVAEDAIAIDRFEISATKNGIIQRSSGNNYWYSKSGDIGRALKAADLADIPVFDGNSDNDGNWVVNVSVYDKSSQKSEKTFTFAIDATPPVVSITNPENSSFISGSTVEISGSIGESDIGSGVESVTLTITGKKDGDETSSPQRASVSGSVWSAVLPLDGWDEGNITISATATDRAGNVSAASAASYTIDQNKPVASPITIKVGENETSSSWLNGDFRASGRVTDTLGLSKENLVLQVKKDGTAQDGINAETTKVSDTEYTWSLVVYAEASGRYEITVGAADNSGKHAEQVTRTVRMDKSAPEVSISNVPAGTKLSGDSYIVRGSTTELPAGASSGLEGMEYRLDGGSWQAMTAGESWTQSLQLGSGGLAEGNHSIEIRATDVAGNESAAASAS
ncbi:MAG: Ig-like domain repeat protein, partial [Treponemataceae bacterium]|nr:Ig-like domain repeat protein [Treponemataceae bacterium]